MSSALEKSVAARGPRRLLAAEETSLAGHASAESPAIEAIPPSRRLRQKIRALAEKSATLLAQNRLLDRLELESLAQRLLAEAGAVQGDADQAGRSYLGWTMVALVSAYWRAPMSVVPHTRRLFLAPRELSGAPEQRQLQSILDRAKQLGYQVLPVDDTAAAIGAISSGDIDGVIGLAPLDVLEKAVDLVLWLGMPCLAIPFSVETGGDGNGHDNSPDQKFDADWLSELIELPFDESATPAPNYLALVRAAKQMFEPDELERLAPRQRATGPLPAAPALDPIASTEAIAYDFLAKGGKYSRPFITLAVYDAMTGGHGARPGAHRHLANLPPAIKRTALSIEAFHKASLVHDDIQDDDQFRYGEPTVHKKFGAPVAINVGDYLIGLGYRLVSRESAALGPQVVSDILDHLAAAHMKLSEGQGAELLWRDTRRRELSPDDALQIYALKTSPAFEAAVLTGLRLVGPTTDYRPDIEEFARCLGIAFQILNDLGDWQPDRHNKLVAAGDIIGGRPTLLWALALAGLAEPSRQKLRHWADQAPASDETVAAIRELYHEAGVFDKATRLVEQYEASARAIASRIQPAPLRQLLAYLIEIVLKRPSPSAA